MRAVAWCLLTVGISLSSASCGIPIRAGANFDRAAEFRPYVTFRWDEPEDRPNADPRLEGNPFFENRLHEAIVRELSARGIRYEEPSELLVRHSISVTDHIEVFEVDPVTEISSDYGPGTQVIQYEQGFLSVKISEAETGETLWVGWARGDISPALMDPERMREWIDEAVELMFNAFPISAGAQGKES